MAIYIYGVEDFPGGAFNSTIKTRLTQLITRDITATLKNITANPGQETVKITFDTSLSAAEKTLLDGDTQGPAGGIIAAASDKIVILVDGVVKTDNFRLDIPADRITFRTITLQKTKWDGSPIAGEQEIVALDPTSVVAINVLEGELDNVGGFSFIVGPDVRRGSFNIAISVQFFSSTALSVRFH